MPHVAARTTPQIDRLRPPVATRTPNPRPRDATALRRLLWRNNRLHDTSNLALHKTLQFARNLPALHRRPTTWPWLSLHFCCSPSSPPIVSSPSSLALVMETAAPPPKRSCFSPPASPSMPRTIFTLPTQATAACAASTSPLTSKPRSAAPPAPPRRPTTAALAPL